MPRMLRSEANAILADATERFQRAGFALPPFAHWAPEEFEDRAAQSQAIIEARLGWDVTDFGQGDFARFGLVLLTLRNGQLSQMASGGGRVYAERLLLAQDGQAAPMQTHLLKTKDIINRGGARLAIRLCGSDEAGRMDMAHGVAIECDGVPRWIAPGAILWLEPGESATLRPGDWHEIRPAGGPCIMSEISTVNDDLNDNVFAGRAASGLTAPIDRFPVLVEDCDPTRLLVSDYDLWLS